MIIEQVNGKNVLLLINVSGMWTPYACARSVSLTITTDFIETSVSGSGNYATFLPTKNSFVGTMDGVVEIDMAGALSIYDLRALQLAQTVLQIRFDRVSEENKLYRSEANFYISDSNDLGTINDMAQFSLGLRGTGAITETVELVPDWSINWTNNANPFQNVRLKVDAAFVHNGAYYINPLTGTDPVNIPAASGATILFQIPGINIVSASLNGVASSSISTSNASWVLAATATRLDVIVTT